MGHVCYPCLPMKVITYITLSKDDQVTVQKIRDGLTDKCDICRTNLASFIVAYTPRDNSNPSLRCVTQ